MWVYCLALCFLGLVVAIVSELGRTAVAEKQSRPPCGNPFKTQTFNGVEEWVLRK